MARTGEALTLTAGSAHAFVGYEPFPGPSIYVYARASTNASTSSVASTGIGALAYWVKLVRSGSSFTGYISSDGVNWLQLGATQNITMAQNVYVGLALSANEASSVVTATFDNVAITMP